MWRNYLTHLLRLLPAQLLISELARVIKDNSGVGAGGARGEGRQVSLLLSKTAVRHDVKLMLPFVCLACRRFFGIEQLVAVLAHIDSDLTLLSALVNNVPAALTPIIDVCVRFGVTYTRAQGAGASINGQGQEDSEGAGVAGWCDRALLCVASLCEMAAVRVRAALMAAQARPHLIVRISVDLVRDVVPLLLSCSHGHEFIWEYLQGALLKTGASARDARAGAATGAASAAAAGVGLGGGASGAGVQAASPVQVGGAAGKLLFVSGGSFSGGGGGSTGGGAVGVGGSEAEADDALPAAPAPEAAECADQPVRTLRAAISLSILSAVEDARTASAAAAGEASGAAAGDRRHASDHDMDIDESGAAGGEAGAAPHARGRSDAAAGGDLVGKYGLARLLRLVCVLVARADLELSLHDVTGASALAWQAHGGSGNGEGGGLLAIVCGCYAPLDDSLASSSANGSGGGGGGGAQAAGGGSLASPTALNGRAAPGGRAGAVSPANAGAQGGTTAPAAKVKEGGGGGGAGSKQRRIMFGRHERLLALCALMLWPRIKAVVPSHVLTAAIRSMWQRFDESEAGGAAGGEAAGGIQVAGGEAPGSRDVEVLLSLLVVRSLTMVGDFVRNVSSLGCSMPGEALNKLADLVSEATDASLVSRALLARDGADGWRGGPAWPVRDAALVHSVYSLLKENKLVHSKGEGDLLNDWLLRVMADPPDPVPKDLVRLLQEAARLASADRSKLQPIPLPRLRPLLEFPPPSVEGGGAASRPGGDGAGDGMAAWGCEGRAWPPASTPGRLLAVLYLLFRLDLLKGHKAERGGGDARLGPGLASRVAAAASANAGDGGLRALDGKGGAAAVEDADMSLYVEAMPLLVDARTLLPHPLHMLQVAPVRCMCLWRRLPHVVRVSRV